MQNRMITSFGVGAVAVAGLLAVNATTEATIIKLNGNTVAGDNYEGDTVGSPVVAEVGAWDASNGNYLWFPHTMAKVANAGSPGAYQGSQYASFAVGPDNNHLTASMSIANGDVIQFDSMVYVSANAAAVDYPFQMMVIGDNTIDGTTLGVGNRLIDFYRHANGTWGASNVGGSFAGPASFAADTWQRWTLDYTVGASTATLTINGVSASIPASNTSLQGSNGFFTVISGYGAQNPTAPFYFDAVPEPASFAAVAIGALALMRRRHH